MEARSRALGSGIDEDEREPQPVCACRDPLDEEEPATAGAEARAGAWRYRSGNFLFDSSGDIRGIPRLEMAHLGDPLEDLGWAIDPLWSNGDVARPRERSRARRHRDLGARERTESRSEGAVLWEIFASFRGSRSGSRRGANMSTGAIPIRSTRSAWYPYSFHNAAGAAPGGGRMRPDVGEMLRRPPQQLPVWCAAA